MCHLEDRNIVRVLVIVLVLVVTVLCWQLFYQLFDEYHMNDSTVHRHFKSYHDFDLSPSRIVNYTSELDSFEFSTTREAVCFMLPAFDNATYNFARSLLFSSRNRSISVFLVIDSIDQDGIVQTEEVYNCCCVHF